MHNIRDFIQKLFLIRLQNVYIYIVIITILLILEDVSNQASLLLVNLKEIIDKLQAKNFSFQNEVKKLRIDNKKLIVSNKKLSIEVNCLKEVLKSKHIM